jgi:hypothetical protein
MRTDPFAAVLATTLIMTGAAFAQRSSEPVCRPREAHAGEVGCWIIVDDSLGSLPSAPLFWHLDTFANRSAAEAAKSRRGTVVESLGKVWLFTIDERDWRPRTGEHVADIGPLPVRQGLQYSAM